MDFSRQDLITLFRLVRMINFIKQVIDQDVLIHQKLSDYLSKNIPSSNSPLKFPQKLAQDDIGILLLDQLFRESRFRGLSLKNRVLNNYEYDWLDYKISDELMIRFFRTIHGKDISSISRQIKWCVG